MSRREQSSFPTLLIFFLLCMFNLTTSSQTYASPHRDAKNAFVQGDLPSVVKLLEGELFPKAKLKGKELEDARGLYGITQFMLGNRGKAESVFRQMLKSNPNAKLDKKYILDPAVEPSFEAIRKNNSGRADAAGVSPASPAARSAINPPSGRLKNSAPLASLPKGPATPPPEVPLPKGESQRPAKQGTVTGLQVKINAPRATLFADGIFIGSPDQKISLDPGVHLISASAEGYVTEEIKVRIEKGRTLQLSLNLKKVGNPAPKQAAINPSPLTSGGKSQQKRSSRGDGLDSSQPKRTLYFNQELPSSSNKKRSKNSYTDQYFQEPPQQQYSQPPQQQYSQPPQQQYSQPPQQQYAQPPQQQYAQPPQQYVQPPVQYPPTYQQPFPQPQYSYPPPAYAAPPAYSPPPTYNYPDPYTQPPAYAAPPPSAYGAPNPYEEEDEAGDVNTPSPRSGASPKSRKKSRRKGSPVLAALPFGVGQFQNGDTGKGAVFLLTEAATIGYAAYIRLKVIPDAQTKFAAYREQEGELPKEEQDAAEIPRTEYLKKMNSYFQYSLIGAGAIYLIGVIDAFSNLDAPPSRRRAVETLPVLPERKYRLALSPQLNGGVTVKFSLNLE